MSVMALRRCGRVEYSDGLRAMRLHREALKQGSDLSTLLLLEHPPLFTLGRGASLSDVLLTEDELKKRGIEVFETDRGGEVTYHGPGQLVAYPIFNLAPKRKDVRRWVLSLEKAMIESCAAFGIEAQLIDKLHGVWVRDAAGDRKIGAVGVHLSNWISTHGIALNIHPNLEHFRLIVPCGIRDKGVTSFAAEGVSASVDEVSQVFVSALAREMEMSVKVLEPELPTVQVVLLREDGKVLLLRRTMERGGFWQTITGRVERGESLAEAAQRELFEETGASGFKVHDLNYLHDFPLEPGITRRKLTTVLWAREAAFYARVPASFTCRLAPREHDDFEWLGLDEAMERLPYAGLKRGVELAFKRGFPG